MKILAFLPMLMLLAIGNGFACGGNCPAGDCPACPCGSTVRYVDLDEYCAPYSWNQKCCKCIAQRISKGSQNRIKYENNYYWGGVIAVREIEAAEFCGLQPWNLVCYSYKGNAQCAHKIYRRDGGWENWESEAAACGCLHSDNLSEVTA